jgi:hypothetical protein
VLVHVQYFCWRCVEGIFWMRNLDAGARFLQAKNATITQLELEIPTGGG